MKTLKIMSIVLLVLMLTATMTFASQKVIGKLHIKKDTQVLLLVSVSGSPPLPFVGTSFEDQTFYIIDSQSISKEEGGGEVYLADGSNFAHKCPTHGRETFEGDVMILIPIHSDEVDGDLFKVELFEKKGK